MRKEKKKSITRRNFVKTFAAGTAAFTIVPRYVLGGPGNIPPSEKLNIAGVGIGGMGRNDVNGLSSQNIVALCDVDHRLASDTFKAYPNAKIYKDFRKMLDKQKDIDAVIVATPDNLHAMVSMWAIKRGKHVYCEKPLTHTVYEARALAEAAREHKVATQMGNQGQAEDSARRLREVIWDGAIGHITEVHVWTDRPSRGLFDEYWPQGVDRPKDTPSVPKDLDWDLWIGPAPFRPYNPVYHPFKWRGWWDFGTGALGDMGCHKIDPIWRNLKLEAPLSVEACSTRVNNETYPLGSKVHYRFGARGDLPPVTLTWYDGGLRPQRPEELEDGRQLGANGTLYIGQKGKILDSTIIPETKRRAYSMPPVTLERSPGHYQEFIDACKGGKPAGSNFDIAGPLTEAVLLGNIALRPQLRDKMTRLRLDWDSKNLKIKNLPEANQFVHRQYRDGWQL